MSGPDDLPEEDETLPDGSFILGELLDKVGGLPTDTQRMIAQHMRRTVIADVAYPEADAFEATSIEFERRRIRARRIAQEMEQADQLGGVDESDSRMATGGAFILDLPAEVPTIWGHGKDIVWAEGEALTITGPTGVGKTTVTGQVVRCRLIGGKVLGMEVTQTSSKVLYLAMDRPQQIARALHRVLRDVPRDVLDKRFVVWQGPPLVDVATNPETLLRMALRAGADTIVIDSLKDAAIGLTKDEVGAGYNRARQLCLAHGVQVLELHHTVKSGTEGKAPDQLEHVYGSAWITAGSGSVVSLFGKAGDLVVRWKHLKQPAHEVGPFDIVHDHETGTSEIFGALDLPTFVRYAGKGGRTAKEVAVQIFDTAKPSQSDVQKARRRLDALVRAGELRVVEGDAATQLPSRWFCIDPNADAAQEFSNDDSDELSALL